MKKFLLKLTVTAAALVAFVVPSFARVDSVQVMQAVPILEGGRVMPLDSYARLKLLQFSGKSTFERKPAIDWLARLWFEPLEAADEQVFLINNPEVPQAMGIEAEGRARYSYKQLVVGIERLESLARAASELEEKQRTPVQQEMINLFINMRTYIDLSVSMQFALPNPALRIYSEEARERLALPEGSEFLSFMDLMERAHVLAEVTESLSARDQSEWTPLQQEVFMLAAELHNQSKGSEGLPPALIPLHGHGEMSWISPWDGIAFGFKNDEIKGDVLALREAAVAFREGNQDAFDKALSVFKASVIQRVVHDADLSHIDLEVKYNKLNPFYRAELLYGLAFLVSLMALARTRQRLHFLALGLVFLAFIPHTLGIVMRMIIMGRPPVTNLYATFVFVAWIGVILCLIMEWLQKSRIGTVCAGLCGITLLLVAGKFSTQGDTLGVVVAVLDSNFWLATHVVCITIGYGGCFVAGLIGHVYLLQALWKKVDDPALVSTMRAVYGTLAFGLIFSFLGTMLGGVWADQSWGRFWGWDPKENGALLIVMWSAILFHAKIARMIGPVGMAAGSVLGVVVVLMAWLGVNLLGVGLHSYGFTSGVARGFFLACAFEIAFAFGVGFLASARLRRT